MDRGSLLKWILIGVAAVLFFQFGYPALFGKKQSSELQPLDVKDSSAPPPERRAPEAYCTIQGPRFRAELGTRGGSLRHVWIEGEKYSREEGGKRVPTDLVTTTAEARMPLRTVLRAPSGTDQVMFDDLDWKIEERSDQACSFGYRDERAALRKVVRADGRPFELVVELTVQNLAREPQKHRLAVEQSDWRTTKEMAGSWGRISEFGTTAVIRAGSETLRLGPDDFEPDDFKDKGFTAERWRRAAASAKWAAVSSAYFSKAVAHLGGPAEPAGEAQIEECWDIARHPNKSDDPNHGHVFRARLAYPVMELGPQASATYRVLAYVGPKERALLAAVGGDGRLQAQELLELGWFGWIGKILIQYLYLLYGVTRTWGWAICLLTITVKVVLFPLSITQIKSSMAMRRLKPQMDEINLRYKDDPAQKGLAIQELWRKNNVTNPMLGCLPVLLQMPVWFALYQALQTAVELYHTPFGPFIPDLSAPGRYFIIPAVLGASSFLQQKMMPMQGDPMQQKMMLYMMPAIFTVFMLFLPAGLGIYFLTNTCLSITQQIAVEKYYQARHKTEGGGENKAPAAVAAGTPRAFGKGKTRVQQDR
ncbi:MAG: YidC/Oxa1 family insertase periplasmic-domain containing protein [Deltaproteobacteria bacterium]|nr:YidC/Oxa1 family insertase periplasmic-domain containing protein [Deltaproteobacteria bacterium]